MSHKAEIISGFLKNKLIFELGMIKNIRMVIPQGTMKNIREGISYINVKT